MRDDISIKLSTDRRLAKSIKENKLKKIKKMFFSIVGIFGITILLGIFYQFGLTSWIISIVVATLLFALMILNVQFSKKAFIIGKIQRIDHDYRLEGKKGTGGFGRAHSNIREKHNLVITVSNNECPEKLHTIVCPPQYEKILRSGDTVFYHPHLNYPATLSNKSKCICVNCGTMQSSQKEACFQCQAILFNFNTVKD